MWFQFSAKKYLKDWKISLKVRTIQLLVRTSWRVLFTVFENDIVRRMNSWLFGENREWRYIKNSASWCEKYYSAKQRRIMVMMLKKFLWRDMPRILRKLYEAKEADPSIDDWRRIQPLMTGGGSLIDGWRRIHPLMTWGGSLHWWLEADPSIDD